MSSLEDEEKALRIAEEMLRRKREDIEKRKAELKKKQELERPVKVILHSYAGGTHLMFRIEPYREDVVELAKKIEGRVYNGVHNSIPIGAWPAFKLSAAELPNVTIHSTKEIEELEAKVHKALYSANFEITKADRFLKVETNRNAATHGLRDIPGSDFSYHQSAYIIPLSEGWRLWEFTEKLPEEQTVTWDEASREFVAKQVEARLRLDAIALAKDWPTEVPGFIGKLKPYQNVGVAFFENNGGSGILGDVMGLGKTPQAIARALQLPGKIVVVTPASLKINWTRSIKKFSNEKFYILQGTTPTHYDMAMMLAKDGPKFIVINYDILSTSTVLDKSYVDENNIKHEKKETKYPWIEIINLMYPDLIIYDEAHYIKNSDSNRSVASRLIQAKSTICLTGTPVLNRPSELWPMLTLVDPVTFPTNERFVNQYTFDGKTTRNVEELRQVLKPLMIRRKREDVYTDLPPLNRIDEAYELSKRAQGLYDKALQGVYEVVALWNPDKSGEQSSIANILVKIQRLKQICAIDKVPATADLATRIYDSSDPSGRAKKVLIFSQFKPTAYAIKARLGSEAIGFVSRNSAGEFVTAQALEQDRLVQEFQNDPDIHYLVVTEKTAKEGHDITEAFAVIFNDHFWTPAAHQQAEGRAYMRASDPHGIDSYYHLAAGTIEDWIQELLAAKLAMIEDVVDGVNNTRVNPDESILTDLIKRIKDGGWRK